MEGVGANYFYNSRVLIQSIRENDLSYAGKLQIIIHFVGDKLNKGTFQKGSILVKEREKSAGIISSGLKSAGIICNRSTFFYVSLFYAISSNSFPSLVIFIMIWRESKVKKIIFSLAKESQAANQTKQKRSDAWS